MITPLLLSFYIDAAHFNYEPAVFLDVGPAIVSNLGAGIDKRLIRSGGFSVDAGGFYLLNTNAKMGTNLNFIITARYKNLIYRHISHGSGFGIAPNKANAGYNFIGLEFKL